MCVAMEREAAVAREVAVDLVATMDPVMTADLESEQAVVGRHGTLMAALRP